MKKSPLGHSGFTMVEMLVASAVFGMVTVGLVTFGSTATRLVARNLSTNHSHDVMRISNQQLQRDLHDAASPFRLVNFDGTTYSDTTVVPTSDQDPFTRAVISTRTNGVRYRKLAGGPYRMTANTTASSTSLTFDFSVSGKVPYVPQVGDKLVIPLLAREYDISAIVITPTVPSPTGKITIADPAGIGFSIDTTTAGNITTGYFYREVAFTVFANQLRTHPNFTGTNKGTCTVVRDRVTSPKPFAVLYSSGSTVSDGGDLRISLESFDTGYSSRRFSGSTATFQAVIPSRTQPTPVSSTSAN